jgi:hypothetical protein
MSRVKRASNFKLSCSIYGASTFVLDSSVASEPYFIRVGGTDSSANFAEAVSFVRAVDSVPLTISADSVVLPALRHHTTIVLSTGRSETNPTETIALIFGGVANARNVYQMRFGFVEKTIVSQMVKAIRLGADFLQRPTDLISMQTATQYLSEKLRLPTHTSLHRRLDARH